MERTGKGAAMNSRPKISIIIPVVNETSGINQTISHLLYQVTSGSAVVEIIVVDGTPEGSTIAAIQHAAIVKLVSRKGRGMQMNAGASVASGDLLLFLHADTRLPDKALELIVSAMQERTYVAGAFDLGIASDRLVFRLIERLASLRSRCTRIPYGDQALFIRKGYFEQLGGFPNIPLMEDVELMRRIKKRKDAIYIIPARVLTSPRRWEREGVIRCTLRNWSLILLYLLGIHPEKLVKFYK